MKITLFLLAISFSYVCLQDNLLCSDDFCQRYTEKEKCREIPNACNIQNETHSGVFLPSPGPCNCCKYCLENLGKGDVCTFGDPISSPPSSVCGDGLQCKAIAANKPTCQTIDTKCTLAQQRYDDDRSSGNLGHMVERPRCDRQGFYEPYVCVPGETCYCVSEDQDRIFGEISITDLPEDGIDCKCSRNFNRAKNLVSNSLHMTEHLRCQSNGDYDAVQCLNSQCFCVDQIDGRPLNSSDDTVNIMEFSSATLWCFNNETHEEYVYHRECELLYREQLKLLKENNENDIEVIGYVLPNCQLDGYYGSVQENKTAKYCVNPSGEILENFEVLKSDPLLNNINCKCARARSLIKDVEKPECCQNGNYKKVQCRRGMCRCVDENGQQSEKEVELEFVKQLSCYNDMCS